MIAYFPLLTLGLFGYRLLSLLIVGACAFTWYWVTQINEGSSPESLREDSDWYIYIHKPRRHGKHHRISINRINLGSEKDALYTIERLIVRTSHSVNVIGRHANIEKHPKTWQRVKSVVRDHPEKAQCTMTK